MHCSAAQGNRSGKLDFVWGDVHRSKTITHTNTHIHMHMHIDLNSHKDGWAMVY